MTGQMIMKDDKRESLKDIKEVIFKKREEKHCKEGKKDILDAQLK